MSRVSLRLVMMALMLLGICLSVGISSYLNTQDSRRQIEELFDAQMLQSAKMLEMFYGAQGRDHRLDMLKNPLILSVNPGKVNTFTEQADATELSYELKLAYQMWTPAKQLMARSDNSDIEPMAPFERGYHKRYYQGELWHLLSYFSDELGVWIITGQRDDVRGELVEQIMGNSFIGPALVVPAVALLMVFLSYWLLQPLESLAAKLKLRSPADMRPLALQLPKELVPVQDALNTYITRISDNLARERRFSADAAHELKTPLAVIKLHRQGWQQAKTEAEQQLHLNAIDTGIGQMTHMVEQLLLLSRVESLSELEVAQTPVAVMVQEVLDQLLPLIADYSWQLELPEEVSVSVDPFYMKLVLKNLLENACKYSGKDQPIKVSCWQEGRQESKQVVIQVLDSGPSLPLEQCRQLTERFFRIADESVPGAGLGLSISAQIVELHKGKLSIQPGTERGLDVRIILPG
ncbi:hypothetical protein AYI74_02165 [Shewanella algae]|uniref:ATP-binding protein n=1 Tax=Shewanella algae TaxID=38313 RepID=UPI0011B65306|nr:ATP-binding protein [Shewanella algae]TWU70063.1 hypothetical protein AYI74_02165 [Shewanella algae]